jgi:hypothetical protein
MPINARLQPENYGHEYFVSVTLTQRVRISAEHFSCG